eukprot:gene7718-8336_t
MMLLLSLLLLILLQIRRVYPNAVDIPQNRSGIYPVVEKLTDAESTVLEEGKKFVHEQLPSSDQRKPLLCTTMMNVSNAFSRKTLIHNAKQLGDACDWVVILYAGNHDDGKFCLHSHHRHPLFRDRFLHCGYSTTEKGNMSIIPKPFLYLETLPYLSKYQYIFLLDEDISLHNFDIKQYQNIHQCALTSIKSPPPIISQPLIHESGNIHRYHNYNRWKDLSYLKNILLTETPFIEQQAPFLDALFFEWFLRSIIIPAQSSIRATESAWGVDCVWCTAAYYFAKDVLGYNMKQSIGCAIVNNGSPVYHLDGKTIETKKKNEDAFFAKGMIALEYYKQLYPHWFMCGYDTRYDWMHPMIEKPPLIRSSGSISGSCKYLIR